MFKLILALSCVVIFCESNMLGGNYSCAQLEGCILPVHMLHLYYVEKDYKEFCQAEVKFKKCVEDFKPRCNNDSVTHRVDSLLAAGEYICSTQGSQVIHAAAKSDCVTNADKKLELHKTIYKHCDIVEMMNGFMYGEASDIAFICYVLEERLTCLTPYINENCGAIYGAFIRELVQRITSLRCLMVARNVSGGFVDAV